MSPDRHDRHACACMSYSKVSYVSRVILVGPDHDKHYVTTVNWFLELRKMRSIMVYCVSTNSSGQCQWVGRRANLNHRANTCVRIRLLHTHTHTHTSAHLVFRTAGESLSTQMRQHSTSHLDIPTDPLNRTSVTFVKERECVGSA